MTTTDYIAIFALTIPTVAICSYLIGYWRGALMARKLCSDLLDEQLKKIRP